MVSQLAVCATGAIYVAEFADDGSFSGTWYEYGEFGTESGTPK